MADDFDINRIDEVIHGRIRLGVMAYLSGADAADFNELKQKLARVRPRTVGQAGRMEGMTPAALALLATHARRVGGAGR